MAIWQVRSTSRDPLDRRSWHAPAAGVRRAARLAPLALIGIALAGCQASVLQPKGPVGDGERQILFNAVFIMLCIIVPTILGTFAFAWWFRADNPKAKRLPHFTFSGRIEIVVWSVPLLTIIFLGAIAWIGSHDLDPAVPMKSREKPLEVQVVSLDWKWLFIYPEQKVASVNELVVPVGRPLQMSLTSASVWNAFFVPGLGSMIYTMNGMTTPLNLLADREGTFYGRSTHLSGDGFSGMHFDTRAVSANAFESWVAKAQASTNTLDQASYETLAKQSMNNPPTLYRLADDGLFGQVVSLAIPPGPGPSGGGAPDVKPKGGR